MAQRAAEERRRKHIKDSGTAEREMCGRGQTYTAGLKGRMEEQNGDKRRRTRLIGRGLQTGRTGNKCGEKKTSHRATRSAHAAFKSEH